MEVPKEVGPEERLGRGVFSYSAARRAARRITLNVFLERPTELELSVDRLDVAPPHEAIGIAEQVGNARGKPFFGWAVVETRKARTNGRRVVSSPLPGENPYHADILLPDATTDDREEQKQHAQELADSATWLDRSAHGSQAHS